MLVGFLAEGWDHLILRAYVARLWQVDEETIEPDVVGEAGHNWQSVIRTTPTALRRFYALNAVMAVIGIDNDGTVDLLNAGLDQDPHHPRHWLHPDVPRFENCRSCRLRSVIETVVPSLTWMPGRRAEWPIVVAVPVECIEAWLPASQAIRQTGAGSMHSERLARHGQKFRLYGKPAASRQDLERIALPFIRQLTADDLVVLRQYSRSFSQFADQCGDQPPVGP